MKKFLVLVISLLVCHVAVNVAGMDDQIYKMLQRLVGKIEKLEEKVDRIEDKINKTTGVPPGKIESHPAESCAWLNKNYYNLESTKYWIEHGGQSKLEHCALDKGGVLPPEITCKTLNEKNPDLPSGLYNLTMKDTTFPAYCDMQTDGGGWLMVGQVKMTEKSDIGRMLRSEIVSHSYTQLSKVQSGRFLLSMDGFADMTSITEIRFYCSTVSNEKTLHIKTSNNTLGRSAVDYLLGRSVPIPQSQGSIVRLDGDNSRIGTDPSSWNWHEQSIYHMPMKVRGPRGSGNTIIGFSTKYGPIVIPPVCDNDNIPHPPSTGIWSYFVR